MLGNLSVTFGNAWWLIAIPLFVPPLIAMSIKSLSGLGQGPAGRCNPVPHGRGHAHSSPG